MEWTDWQGLFFLFFHHIGKRCRDRLRPIVWTNKTNIVRNKYNLCLVSFQMHSCVCEVTYILFLQLSEPVWPGLILRNLHWSFRTQKMSQSKSNPPLLSEIFEGPTIMFLTIARVNPQATPPMSHLLNERYVVKSVVISVHVTGTDPIGWGQQISTCSRNVCKELGRNISLNSVGQLISGFEFLKHSWDESYCGNLIMPATI